MKKSSVNKSRRRVAAQSQRRIIRVFSEGQVTEPEYLRRLASSNSNVALKIMKSGKSPKILLHEAQKLYDSDKEIRESDQIWCIFDVDNYTIQHVDEIKRRATRSSIQTVVSNPCFELWLVLHQEKQTAPVINSKIQQRAVALGLIEGKEIAAAGWPCLFANYEDAKKRAKALNEMHSENGSPPGSNPSTDVWRLVDVLRS